MKTALQKIEDQALQEIKDYSTGKRYFVSKFQDSVRKRNIKAKKKLIGTGNEGALSGTGPLEEEYIIEERIVKQGKEYCLKSKNKNKNLGCYPTKAGAKKREKQVQYFKHMKESIELDEGILQWLGLAKEEEKEQYQDYSQPIQDYPLWIGAFPFKEMDEAAKKFDVIILMAKDVVELASLHRAKQYEAYKNKGFIIDEYAIDDIEVDPGGEDEKVKNAGQRALQELSQGKRVLITCAQGLNRSAAVTCLTLQGLGISAEEAYRVIQTSRTAKKQALEFLKASEQNRRAKKLGNQAFMLHGVPHERFLQLVGLDTDKVTLQEKIRKLVAQVLKEAYITNIRKRG
jgi:protein-tyrosine phosphatase